MRKRIAALARGLLLLLATAGAGSAWASETATFTYDPRGRLMQTSHSGGPNHGIASCYSFDKADNRTSRTIGTTCSASPPGPSFSVNDVAAIEGGSLVFTVTKTGSASGTTTVDYATANGTATAGSDYTAQSGTLTFTAAQTSNTVSVTTTDDSAVESAETFKLDLSNATGGATLGSPNSASATINDNDGSTNQPPVANPDTTSGAVCTGGPTINVVANDTDPEGNLPLSVISVTSLDPAMDVSVASSTSVHAHNGSGATGGMDARYTVQDSLGATSIGTLTVIWTDTGACQ